MKNDLSRCIFILISLAILIVHSSCSDFVPDNWEVEIPKVGFSSSIRPVDLNNDGIKDLVIGGGGAEFMPTKNGVTALNGKDGALLWRVATRNQIIGSAIFQDINADNIPDVFIGGRSALFLAIDGANGSLLWNYLEDDKAVDLINDTTLLNFFTPQFIPDQDEDGLDDLLVSFGGFIKAKAQEKDRPGGCIIIISSRTGKELTRFGMPDGAETYMSALVHDFGHSGTLTVIFGSGGETINGHLYKISLPDLLQNKLSKVKVLASGNGKGFIASPVLADVNLDGIRDIIANPVNGNMICIDGQSDKILWELKVDPVFEVYTSPAPGFFTTDDHIPDFFSSMGAGPWPDTKFTRHLLIDGKNGEQIYSDTFGLFQYASPVTFDFTQDGLDDILLAINEKKIFKEISPKTKLYVNELTILDFHNNNSHKLGKTRLGSNLGATPLITDLDGDEWIDLIYCYMEDANNFYSFQKGKIERIEINVKAGKTLKWGCFMGKDHNGAF